MRFFLPAVALLLAADNPGSGGAPAAPAPPAKPLLYSERLFQLQKGGKSLSLDAKLTVAESYIEEVEPKLAKMEQLQVEHDEAVRIAKTPTEQAARIMAESPSQAAAHILALAGVAAMPTRPASNLSEMDGKHTAAREPGKTGLDAAIAKSQASAAARKG